MSEEDLRGAVCQALVQLQWPPVGEVITIAKPWNGPVLHGSTMFLRLKGGDRVTVLERGGDGLLYGQVEGQEDTPGWFGGAGCQAVFDIRLDVPVGPDVDEAVDLGGDLGSPQDEDGLGSVKSDPLVFPTKASHVGPSTNGFDDISVEVEDYLQRHNIDPNASELLRAQPPDMQREIIKSDMSNCRNPSAVLLSRIERVRGGRGAPVERARSRSRRGDSFGRSGGGQEERWPVSRAPSSFTDEAPNAAALRTATDVEEYLARNNIDSNAGSVLRALPPDLQEQVMSSDLSNSRNPSAVLLSRIRQLEARAAPTALPRGPPPIMAVDWRPPISSGLPSQAPRAARGSAAVEAYILSNNLDSKVAADLRALRPDEQLQVMTPPLTNPRNPSAIVSSRINAVKSEARHRSPVEEYLVRNGIDGSARTALLSAPWDIQMKVIEQDLSNCRNPSAVLLSRLRNLSG